MSKTLITAAATLGLAATALTPFTPSLSASRNIVLVHGGFVDGSGWQGVYSILKKKGYNVSIVQNPTLSLADDVAVTKRTIAQQDGPVVLVGHSYGGVVVSEAGTDEKVKAVVYIAAFAPDKGESVSSLIANPPAGAPVPPILPPVDGFLFLDKAKFAASFAADVDAETASFMADSQVPWGVEALVRRRHRAGLEEQAELLSGGRGRPHDPASGAAHDGEARRIDGCGSGWQPRRLCFQAGSRCRAHRAGRDRQVTLRCF